MSEFPCEGRRYNRFNGRPHNDFMFPCSVAPTLRAHETNLEDFADTGSKVGARTPSAEDVDKMLPGFNSFLIVDSQMDAFCLLAFEDNFSLERACAVVDWHTGMINKLGRITAEEIEAIGEQEALIELYSVSQRASSDQSFHRSFEFTGPADRQGIPLPLVDFVSERAAQNLLATQEILNSQLV